MSELAFIQVISMFAQGIVIYQSKLPRDAGHSCPDGQFGQGVDQNCDVHLRRSPEGRDVGNSPLSRGRNTFQRSRASAAFSGKPKKGQSWSVGIWMLQNKRQMFGSVNEKSLCGIYLVSIKIIFNIFLSVRRNRISASFPPRNYFWISWILDKQTISRIWCPEMEKVKNISDIKKLEKELKKRRRNWRLKKESEFILWCQQNKTDHIHIAYHVGKHDVIIYRFAPVLASLVDARNWDGRECHWVIKLVTVYKEAVTVCLTRYFI